MLSHVSKIDQLIDSVLAKQHELQQQSLKLEQAHMEKIAKFQREALEVTQKLQTEAMQRLKIQKIF